MSFVSTVVSLNEYADDNDLFSSGVTPELRLRWRVDKELIAGVVYSSTSSSSSPSSC